MTGVCPSADDGLQTVGNIALVYQKIAAVEEGGYGSAKKQILMIIMNASVIAIIMIGGFQVEAKAPGRQ